MKTFILIFSAVLSLNASALTEAEFFANFSQDSRLARAQAREVCDDIFAAWPTAQYTSRIQALGDAWSQDPDAAYEILSTCQGAWITRYLDPVKAPQIRHQQERASIGEYISKMDLIAMAKYLREEIRLFAKIKPDADASIPPAPYEILTNIASTDRQLDLALNYETSNALKGAISAGGMVGATLAAGRGIFKMKKSRAVVATKALKRSFYVAILAIGASELVELGLWQARFNDLSAQAENYRRALTDKRTIRALALEEFNKSIELLGYFYTYKMYVKDGGQDSKPLAASEACDNQLRARLTQGSGQIDPQFIFRSQCRDAGNLWLDASLYLQQNFPSDDDAQFIADKLMAKAKRAFWAFEETRAYLKSLLVCKPILDPLIVPAEGMECRDPETGAQAT